MLPTLSPTDPFSGTRLTGGPKLEVPQVIRFMHFNDSPGVKVSPSGERSQYLKIFFCLSRCLNLR